VNELDKVTEPISWYACHYQENGHEPQASKHHIKRKSSLESNVTYMSQNGLFMSEHSIRNRRV